MTAKNENIARAERANDALHFYEPDCPKANLTGEVLVDLLCDLMHWAREKDEDFADLLKQAQASFEDELSKEQDEDCANRGEGGAK